MSSWLTMSDFKLRSVSKAPCHAASHSAQSPDVQDCSWTLLPDTPPLEALIWASRCQGPSRSSSSDSRPCTNSPTARTSPLPTHLFWPCELFLAMKMGLPAHRLTPAGPGPCHQVSEDEAGLHRLSLKTRDGASLSEFLGPGDSVP